MCSFVVEGGVYEDVRSQGEALMVIECHVVQLPCQGVLYLVTGGGGERPMAGSNGGMSTVAAARWDPVGEEKG